jgi:hypothetical protein
MPGPHVHHNVYCDESGITQRFLVYGGVITPAANADEICAVLKRWRQKTGMHRELKWTKVSKAKLPEYKNFIDGFFYYALREAIHFQAVVFDTHDPGYRRFLRANKDLGFYKLYYQFLLHKFGSYALTDATRLFVFLDESSQLTESRRDVMKIVLNRGIRQRWQRNADIVETVASLVSHENDLMQVADVLMGAVAFHWNQRHRLKQAAPPKTELAAYIASKARLRFLYQGTSPKRGGFGIWSFKFIQGRRRILPTPPNNTPGSAG